MVHTLKISFVLLFVLLLSNLSFAQVAGSRSNGDASVKDVKAADLTNPALNSDVNPFSGTFSASQDLGTVCTPSGLSFNLKMQYSSVYSMGNNVVPASGIPYGDGWSLSIPSISVSSESYFKYPPCDNVNNRTYDNSAGHKEAEAEGQNMWFSPVINIPGVISDRFILKYQNSAARGGWYVFVPSRFDTYVEAWFDGTYIWQVYLPDGTMYEFSIAQFQSKNASNQRVDNTNTDNTDYGHCHQIIDNIRTSSDYQKAMANLVLPKEEPVIWYCSRITNPLKNSYGQEIIFKYDKFGDFDFYKEYSQPGIGDALAHTFRPYNNVNTIYYRDVFLKDIIAVSYAGEVERIHLNYNTLNLNPNDVPNMLIYDSNSPGSNGVYQKDALYNYKVVYDDGINNISGFNEIDALGLPGDFTPSANTFNSNGAWLRYYHIKSDYNSNADVTSFLNPTNPYVGYNTTNENQNQAHYYSTSISSTAQDIPFDHSFLESPRLNTGNTTVLPAGDIYEIKTLLYYPFTLNIEGEGNCNFDINIVSGSSDNEPNTNIGTNVYPNFSKSFPVFTTFNQALKWNTLAARFNSQYGVLTTSNFFVMPNLPRQFRGFNIQIGPANSDNDFWADPYGSLLAHTEVVDQYPWTNSDQSSFNTYFNEFPLGESMFKSTADIPKNFGIGLPWHMMKDLYADFDVFHTPPPDSDPNDAEYCDDDPGTYSPPSLHVFHFWWNTQNNRPISANWDNVPTRATSDFKLKAVALVRYSKSPYMLSEVVHYKTNGEVCSSDINYNTGLVITQKYAFEYTRQQDDILNNKQNQNLDNDFYGTRQVFLLSAIKEIPVNPSMPGNPPTYNIATVPATQFGYTMMMPNYNLTEPDYHTNGKVFAMTSVTDRLGSIKKIDYYPMVSQNPSEPVARYLGGNVTPLECMYLQQTGNPVTSIAKPGNYKVQLVVKTVSLYSEKDASINLSQPYAKRWDYEYFTPTAIANGLVFSDLPAEAAPNNPNFIRKHFVQNAWSQDAGYELTVVTEPAIDNLHARAKTKYYHYGATGTTSPVNVPGILFGKMYKVESYDERGLLIKKKDIEYKVNFVYANAVFGHWFSNPNVSTTEYTGAPDAAPSDFLYLAIMNHAYSTNINFLESRYGSHFYVSSSANHNNYLNSFFVRTTKETETEYEYYPPPTLTAIKYNLANQPVSVGAKFTVGGKSMQTPATPTDPLLACINYSNYTTISLSTVTDYQYWDADDPEGHTSSEGFRNLIPDFYNSSPNSTWQLANEPSWMLFSKTVTSPESPGTKKREEYYYYYDLLNYYGDAYFAGETDFGTEGDAIAKFGVLYWSYEQRMRSIMYEQRNISQTPQTSPLVYSKYFWYDNLGHCLPDEVPSSSLVYFNSADNPPLAPPSDGNNFAPICDAQAVASLTSSEVPPEERIENVDCTNKFKLAYRYTALQVNDVPVASRDAYGFTNYTAPSPAYPASSSSYQIYPIMRFRLGSIMYNDYSHISNDNVNVGDPTVYREVMMPVFPFDTVVVDSVRLRNVYGQVKISRDEKGICTRYFYDNFTVVYHIDQNPIPPPQNYQSVIATNIGVPTKKIYGWNSDSYYNTFPLSDALTTTYEYNPDYSLRKATNPNGYFETNLYDEFGRLSKVSLDDLNTVALKKINYHTWQNNNSQDFNQRAAENYIETFTFNGTDDNQPLRTRQYIDPLGRAYNTLTQVCPAYNTLLGLNFVDNSSTVGSTMVYSGLSEYDNWGRPSSALKNFLMSSVTSFAPRDPSLSNNSSIAHNDFQYEYNQYSRVLKSSKYGEDITTGHPVNDNYDLITGLTLSNELSLSSAEITLLMPGGVQNFKFKKAALMDEDNKKSIEYYNAFGQKVAVKQYLGLLPVRTLFVCDGRDMVTKTINPDLQQSTYKYNLLGLLWEKNSPDAGRTRYMYDRSGNVTMEQDANGVNGADNGHDVPYLRWYQYDHFGRLTKQSIYNLPYAYAPDDVESDPNYSYYNPLSSDDVLAQDPHESSDYDAANHTSVYYTDNTYSTNVRAIIPSNGNSLNWIRQYVNINNSNLTYTLDKVADPTDLNHVEKEWIYYDPGRDYSSLYTSFDVPAGFQSFGFNDASNGRVCWSIAYNKLAGSANKPIQYCFYDYFTNGKIHDQIYQYNVVDAGGCGNAQANTQKVSITYTLNRARSITRKRVDFNCDNNLSNEPDYTNGYDSWNRLVNVSYNPTCETGGLTPAKLCSLEYDDASGLLKNIKHNVYNSSTLTDITINQINYTYDTRDRLTQMADHFLLYDLYYDGVLPPPNNSANAVTGDLNYNGNINGIMATYDLVTNVTSASAYSQDFQGATLYGYRYDGLNRLTKADASVLDALTPLNSASGAPQLTYGDESYTYDKIGNIQTLTRGHYYAPQLVSNPANEVDHRDYAYNLADNRLVAVDDWSWAQNVTFNYDDNGNLRDHGMKNIGSINYRMTNLPSTMDKTDLHTLSYEYDAEDTRISKRDDDGSPTQNPTSAEYYLKDCEGQILGISRASSDVVNSGMWTPVWTMYANAGANRIAEIEGTCNLKFYINDHLGNTRVKYDTYFANPNSNSFEYVLEDVYDYFPYGKTLRSYIASSNYEKFQFTGKERDQETELDYFGARFYDSELGRFLAVDPLEMKYYDVNPYIYCLGNPLHLKDTDGRDVFPSAEFNNSNYNIAYIYLRNNNSAYNGMISKYENTRAFNLRLGTDDKKIPLGAGGVTNYHYEFRTVKGVKKTTKIEASSNFPTTYSSGDMLLYNFYILIHEATHAFEPMDPTIATLNQSGDHNAFAALISKTRAAWTELSTDLNLGLTSDQIREVSFWGAEGSDLFKLYIERLVTMNGTTVEKETKLYENRVNDILNQTVNLPK